MADIRSLPPYQGAHWSALFRLALRGRVSWPANAFPLWPVPVEGGASEILKGDPVRVGLVFPSSLSGVVGEMLSALESVPTMHGHFQPGVTIRFEEAVCRITGDPWKPESPAELLPGHIEAEVAELAALGRFSIRFTTPMRITRPAGAKGDSHRFLDEEYCFMGGALPNTAESPVSLIASRARGFEETSEACDAATAGGALCWLDASYGSGDKSKTFGGIVGELHFEGGLSREVAFRLVAGQYLGAGRNAPLGFGFYSIPQLDSVRTICPLARGRSILDRALAPDSLRAALASQKDSSPGPDGLTVEDARAGGPAYLDAVRTAALAPGGFPGALRVFRIPKPDGTTRQIFVQNLGERIVHRALSERLAPTIDGLLSASAYAYRRGLNRKNAAGTLRALLAEGYTNGIKADIAAFFDSVPHPPLLSILEGIFPGDPAVAEIARWLSRAATQGAKGLPQGGILSPLLSNLYLDRFDREMEAEGFRLVRYADDFVVLFRDDVSTVEGKEKVVAALARLGLALKEEKTETLDPKVPVRFLGMLVSADGIAESEKGDAEQIDDWNPVFSASWRKGEPVYLTTACRGAWSSGANLVVKFDDDHQSSIPWNRVGRLVIVGRSPFSGGMVYRAVREAIPVTFLDIMGRSVGHVRSESGMLPEMLDAQRKAARDAGFRLAFAREVISAKIGNSAVLLRRNGIAVPDLSACVAKAEAAESLDSLRGHEGNAARLYFADFARMVEPFEFKGRVYRPPDGAVNVMLSFGYTLLYNRIGSVLADKGFDPRQGFFHEGRGSHMALASDLQEELRHLVDRVVLSLIHRKEVKPDDFPPAIIQGRLSCRLGGNAFRAFIHRFEATMSATTTVDSVGKISYNGWLDEMADRLKRALKMGIPYRALRIR